MRNLGLILWVLALIAFGVAAIADPTPWWTALRWVAGGLALVVASRLADDRWPR